MSPLGRRLLDRYDSGPDHAGVTTAMLDRAVTLGWISPEDRDTRTD